MSLNHQIHVKQIIHTYVYYIIPRLDEAFPEGEDATGPAREEENRLRERQHVTDGGYEAQCVCGDLLL